MTKEKDKKEYELSFFIKEEADLEKIKAFLTNRGFEITYISELEKRQTAYPIKKETSAYFGFCHFLAYADEVASLNKDLRIENYCLRFLIVSNPVKKTEGKQSRKPSNLAEKKTSKIEQKPADAITNEELEKKLEEILK
jgi:ribosomal protein S6